MAKWSEEQRARHAEAHARTARERVRFCIYCLDKVWSEDHVPWHVQAKRAATFAMNGVDIPRPPLFTSSKRIRGYILHHKTAIHEIAAVDNGQFIRVNNEGVSLATTAKQMLETVHHRQNTIAGSIDHHNTIAEIAGEKKKVAIPRFQMRLLPTSRK